MKTPFDQKNKNFSDRAHDAAVEQIYKPYFNYEDIEIVDMSNTQDDYFKGIDRIVKALDDFTVQERFRRAKYAHYRQLTVTAHNHRSGKTGDFFKLDADLYVYGYLSDNGKFIEAIIVDCRRFKELVLDGVLEPDDKSWYRRKSQQIWAFNFDTLAEHDLILYHIGEDRG